MRLHRKPRRVCALVRGENVVLWRLVADRDEAGLFWFWAVCS